MRQRVALLLFAVASLTATAQQLPYQNPLLTAEQRADDLLSRLTLEEKAKRRGQIKRYQSLSFWTPNINIFRDPRWGRGQETYGEDPYLTAQMGKAVVRGLQGPDAADGYYKTLACAKHYAVHSGPEWNRHSFKSKTCLHATCGKRICLHSSRWCRSRMWLR